MVRFLCCLLFLWCASSSTIAQTSKGDAHFQQAKVWLEKGDVNKALKSLDNARAEFLKTKTWYWYFVVTQSISIIYQDTNKGAESEKVLKEAAAIIPKDSPDNLMLHAQLYDNLGYNYLYNLQDTDQAIKAYSESIRLYEQGGKDKLPELAYEKVNRGITYQNKDAFDLALPDLLSAIAIYEKEANTEKNTLVNAYNALGNCYRALSNYREAVVVFRKGLKAALESDDKELQAGSYNDLAITLQETGNYEEALANIEKAKKIDEELFGKDADHYGKACINSAITLKSMGDLPSAFQQYQEVMNIYSQTPPKNIQDLIDVMLSVAGITNEMGLFEQSKLIHAQAMKLTVDDQGENSLGVADVYTSMAVAAYNDSEYDQSLNYNFKALDIMQTQKYTGARDYAQIYNNVGLAYDEMMEIELSLKYKNQALDLYKKMFGESHPSVAMAISNIGLSYEMAEDYDKTLEFLIPALNMRIKTLGPTHEEVGTNYLNIGLMYLKKFDLDKALLNLEKARAIYDVYDKKKEKVMIYNRLALVYFEKKDRTKAMQCYQKAIIANVLNFVNENADVFPEKPEYLNYYELIISYTGKADVLGDRGDVPGMATGMKHLDAADRILKDKAVLLSNPKDRLRLAQLNAFFTESGMNLVDKLITKTKDPVFLEKAFYFSERNKANELYADIKTSRAVSIARVPAKTLTRQRELANLVQAADQQLAQAYSTSNQELITKLKSQLFDLSQETKVIEQDLAKNSTAYSTATGQRELPMWQQVKAALGPKTAMVSYIVTDSAKYVLIGTESRLILQKINPKTDLEKMVRGFRNQIKFQGAGISSTSQEIAKVIWKPVEEAFAQLGEIENVVILPDGPLSLLPFEALQNNGRYLLETYHIRYHVSGAMMIESAKGSPPKKPSFVALAPVFADEETNFVNKSCEPLVEKTDSTSRAFTLDGDYITPLPGTELEVQEIHKSVLGSDQLSKYFLKKDANEELIKKGELSKYDYIHFATHGLVNGQHPELSGLLLAQDKNSEEDGVLYSGEIYGLQLKAELVTLSACETALGKRVEGEGVRGLTSAFLFAGARTVVVSLWKVADESTARLMINFYDQLLAGKDKASALREAKLLLLRDAKYAHPFYWAPFVQIGAN